MTSISGVRTEDTQMRATPGASRTLLNRRLWIPVLLVGAFILFTAAMLVAMSWHSLQRLAPLQTHVRYLSELQQSGLQIQELLRDADRRKALPDVREFKALHRAVRGLIRENGSLAPTTEGYLREELHDSEHVERLDLVTSTLKRTTQLLNDLLERARRKPEPVAEVRLPEVIAELLALVRYQIPDRIRLEQEIPSALHCRLPRDSSARPC